MTSPQPSSPSAAEVLRPGLDRLPSRCTQCGSALLSADPPLGRAAYGSLTCTACGRVLAYLRAGFATRTGQPITRYQSVFGPSSAAAQRGEWRLLGCSDDCGRHAHDPYAHEAHGRRQVETAQRARLHGTLRVGPLAIDFDVIRVTVDGIVIDVTPTEFLLVGRLARQVGTVVTVAELIDSVWGTDYTVAERTTAGTPPLPPDAHLLRVNLARLRKRLGAAGRLIHTIPAVGYVLADEP